MLPGQALSSMPEPFCEYSSILSEYGLVLADLFACSSTVIVPMTRKKTHFCRPYELQEPCSTVYSAWARVKLMARQDVVRNEVRAELGRQGFESLTDCYGADAKYAV